MTQAPPLRKPGWKVVGERGNVLGHHRRICWMFGDEERGYCMTTDLIPGGQFDEIAAMIVVAKQQAFQVANTTLIDLYWKVGEYISRKIDSAEWVTASSSNWPNIWRGRNPVCEDLRIATCFECGNSMRLTAMTQKFQHC